MTHFCACRSGVWLWFLSNVDQASVQWCKAGRMDEEGTGLQTQVSNPIKLDTITCTCRSFILPVWLHRGHADGRFPQEDYLPRFTEQVFPKPVVLQDLTHQGISISILYLIIIVIKRISRAPICHTRWEHRALYNKPVVLKDLTHQGISISNIYCI